MEKMRQRRVFNINIEQVAMSEFKNRRMVLFCTNCLTEVQLIGKWKNHIENYAGTGFFGAIFVRKMTPYFWRKFSVFKTSKYIFLQLDFGPPLFK